MDNFAIQSLNYELKLLREDLDSLIVKEENVPPLTHLEYIKLDQKIDELAKGCKVFDSILEDLRQFDKGVHGITRSRDQQEIHHKAMGALIPVVFRGPKMKLRHHEIMDKYGVVEINQALLITMGRRFGKTISMIMITIAILRNIPHVKMVVIASSSIAARAYMNQVKEYFGKFFGTVSFLKENEDELYHKFNESDIRKLEVKSSMSGDNLRGLGGDVIMIEEIAFVHPKALNVVIPPIYSVDHTALIALSTLSPNSENTFNLMVESGLFMVHRVMMVCKSCLEKGIMVMCEHEKDKYPAWLSDGSKQEQIKKIMGGKSEAYEIENLGIPPGLKDSEKKVFSPHLVMQFLSAPRVPLVRRAWYVFVVVDPVAGSYHKETRGSDFVILSIAYPNRVLLGIDALDVNVRQDYEETLISHLRRVRELPHCEKAKFIVDAETGSGTDAGTIQEIVMTNFLNVKCLNHRGPDRKPGTLTTEEVKHDGARMTTELLLKDEIAIHENFITHPPNEVKICDIPHEILFLCA